MLLFLLTKAYKKTTWELWSHHGKKQSWERSWWTSCQWITVCFCKRAFRSGALVVSSQIESFNSYLELTECSAKLHVIKWIVIILDTDWSIQSCWNTQHRSVYDAKQQLFTVATYRGLFKSLTLSLSNTTKMVNTWYSYFNRVCSYQ